MDDSRQKLLDCAGQTFAEKGFEAATVREIVTRAGMNVAAVNYHFGDKERLYVEAIKAAECASGMPVTFEWPAGTTPQQKLAIFIRRMVADMLDVHRPTWHTKLMMRALLEPTPACEEIVRDFISPKFTLLGDILDEIVPGKLTAQRRQLFSFSVVGQVLLYRFHQPVGRLLIGEASFQQLATNLELLADHITQFTLHGLQCASDANGAQRETSQRGANA